jgi:hypothetical protein
VYSPCSWVFLTLVPRWKAEFSALGSGAAFASETCAFKAIVVLNLELGLATERHARADAAGGQHGGCLPRTTPTMPRAGLADTTSVAACFRRR